jgi:hypothetical protein
LRPCLGPFFSRAFVFLGVLVIVTLVFTLCSRGVIYPVFSRFRVGHLHLHFIVFPPKDCVHEPNFQYDEFDFLDANFISNIVWVLCKYKEASSEELRHKISKGKTCTNNRRPDGGKMCGEGLTEKGS